MNYTRQEILDVVNTQLPLWIKKDEAVKEAVFYLINLKFETKKDSGDKFTKMLNELKKDREAQTRKWEKQEAEDKKKWEKQEAEDKKKWEKQEAEDKKKWEAQEKKWETKEAEDKKKWEKQEAEDKKKWEVQEKKWDENNAIIRKMLENIDKHDVDIKRMLANIEDLNTRYVVNIGAIGSRWGMNAESSFRNALKAILEKSFPVKVINYNETDTHCLVYEKPTSVEIDVIIYNGITILCEIKSSVSRGDVYDFIKKIHFYEKKEKVNVSRKIIISPMIDTDAKQEAEYYKMEIYSTPKEIKLIV